MAQGHPRATSQGLGPFGEGGREARSTAGPCPISLARHLHPPPPTQPALHCLPWVPR